MNNYQGRYNESVMKKDEIGERIVRQLLQPQGVRYLLEVSRILDKDPDYLQFHSASVSMKVNELLSGSARSEQVSEHNVAKIVREAVVRLRSVER
jgi:hypothetical protein